MGYGRKSRRAPKRKGSRGSSYLNAAGKRIRVYPGDNVIRGQVVNTLSKYGPSLLGALEQQKSDRQAVGYRGRGLYQGSGGYWGAMGDRVAGAVGFNTNGMLDKVESGLAGTGVGKWWRGVTGQGAYNTNATIQDGGSGVMEIPSFAPSTDGCSVVISHKEYVADIHAPGIENGVISPFQNITYAINPGMYRSFPWLAQIAGNYEEYTMGQLIFTYRSTTSDIAANSSGQVGTIIMATQYNPGQDPFGDKQQMLEYDLAMSGKTTQSMLHGVECDPSKLSGSTGKYIRTAPIPAGSDIKTYDLGTLNIAISNVPATYANQSLGELWVSYTVELRKPRFWSGRGFQIPRDVFCQPSPLGLPACPFSGLTHTLLSGRSNSIGGILEGALVPVSGVPETSLYTFPSTFTGYVRVTCNVSYTPKDDGAAPFPNDGISLFVIGNVRGVRDMVELNGQTHYLHGCSYGSPVNQYTAVMVMDLFVGLPSSSDTDTPVNSAFYLQVNGSNVDIIRSCSLEITQTNAQFLTSLGGKNDKVEWINDDSGAPAVYP